MGRAKELSELFPPVGVDVRDKRAAILSSPANGAILAPPDSHSPAPNVGGKALVGSTARLPWPAPSSSSVQDFR